MTNTNKLVIVIAIILIIVCLIIGNINKNTDENSIDTGEETRKVTYNTVTNEVIGRKEYVVYDKNTGKEITRVLEEHQLKIYETNPYYEELPVDSSKIENVIE